MDIIYILVSAVLLGQTVYSLRYLYHYKKNPFIAHKAHTIALFFLVIWFGGLCFFVGDSLAPFYDGSTGKYHVSEEYMQVDCSDRDLDMIEGTFYHELGHHIFYEYLTKEEQDIWKETEFEDYPSWYGSTNYDENFAESFKDYIVGDELACCEEQREFMRSYVDKYLNYLYINQWDDGYYQIYHPEEDRYSYHRKRNDYGT